MKRSVINRAFRDALASFTRNLWALPPNPKWDITDFGLGDFDRHGLTLITLASEREYSEKLMFARHGQTTPWHAHARKKEDIICRAGTLAVLLSPTRPLPGNLPAGRFEAPVDGVAAAFTAGAPSFLAAGSRVTLHPGIWHSFWPTSEDCIIGEVSTANDDLHDNIFLNPLVGRFPGIEEDEPAEIRLLSE